jgi:hypothetical protein
VDFASVNPIARAVLYEGYLLYPYRTSALKNRQPCAFGSLYPRDYAQATGDIEPWSMQVECLVSGDNPATVEGAVRFLQAHDQNAIEREVRFTAMEMERAQTVRFSFASTASRALEGSAELSVDRMAPSIFKVRTRIANQTPAGNADHVMLSTQIMLGVSGGQFLSLIDPPDEARRFADGCQNRGAWPALVGDRALANRILAAPIILYDFPEIAPESPGNLFDGTEIDELLTLRIMTLTDSEKQALRCDDQARALLDRTENLPSDQMLALHGRLSGHRGPHAMGIGPGDRVLIRPKGRADVLDLALDGKSATVVSVEENFEGQVFFALAMDDDPGHDLGIEGKPGHRFFFRRDELELL